MGFSASWKVPRHTFWSVYGTLSVFCCGESLPLILIDSSASGKPQGTCGREAGKKLEFVYVSCVLAGWLATKEVDCTSLLLNTSLHVGTQLRFLLNASLHVATASVPPEHKLACRYAASEMCLCP